MISRIGDRFTAARDLFEKWFPGVNSALILSPITLFFYVVGPYDFNDPMVWGLFIFPAIYVVNMNDEIRRSRKVYFLGRQFNPSLYYSSWMEELRDEEDVKGIRNILRNSAEIMEPATLSATFDSIAILVDVFSTAEEKEKIRQIVKQESEASD